MRQSGLDGWWKGFAGTVLMALPVIVGAMVFVVRDERVAFASVLY